MVNANLVALGIGLVIFAGIAIYNYISEPSPQRASAVRRRRNSNGHNDDKEYKSDLCTICLDGEVAVKFFPCKHACLCYSCWKKYMPTLSKSSCPLCRRSIDYIGYV